MENIKKGAEDNDGKSCPWVGRWTIDVKKCTGCAECVDACPRSLLKIENRKVNITDETICNQCGECERACAYLAIELT